ncbi:MAG: DUF4097 family beta strand repeat protein [Planctomycetes bacterium]|nr:DUF4097 family beta strand repeat protein [Planctomycetota bacterium]
MRSTLLLPLLFAAAACSCQRYTARRTVDYTLDAAGLQQFVCRSHNGGITLVGNAEAVQVAVRADITAHAPSEAEAQALLHELDAAPVRDGDRLTVTGTARRSDWTSGSSFTFHVTLPAHLAVDLRSHNGRLDLRGTTGDVAAETHNGDVVGTVAGARLAVVTHNGDVRLQLRKAPQDASIETHNGAVVLDLTAGEGVQVTAATHNGRIECALPLQDRQQARNRLAGRLGDGKGRLRATTHNGDVVLR